MDTHTFYIYDMYKNYNLNKQLYIDKALVSIINLGNKCYSDSILICLYNTLKLTDYFIAQDSQYEKDIDLDIKRKKQFLFTHIYKNEFLIKYRDAILYNPKIFYNITYTFLPKYNNTHQHDSNEFLLDLLQLLHSGLSYNIDIHISGQVQNETDILMKEYYIFWKQLYQNNFSIIITLFHAVSINLFQCITCNKETIKFEPFNTIQLPIKTTPQLLSDSLDIYFTSYNILDRTCPSCNNSGCHVEHSIFTLPNYLIIQLKRFHNHQHKINTLIDFPLDDLDLTKYITKKKNDPNHYIYSLYAVNNHSGNTQQGHYYTFFKNHDNWYQSNDSIITKIPHNNIVTPNAYILFYLRKFETKPNNN